MSTTYWISLGLVVVGALNWGLVGLFQFDLVAELFGGPETAASRAVYTLVGLAAILLLVVRNQPAVPGITAETRSLG
jgi:uncharacterized membrane protein YuzA (DUF378 family)